MPKITAKHDPKWSVSSCRRPAIALSLNTSTTALLLLQLHELLIRPCQRPRSRASGTHHVPRAARAGMRLAHDVHAMRLPPCCRRRCASAQSAAAERRLMVTTTSCQKRQKCSFAMIAIDSRLVLLSFFTQLFAYVTMAQSYYLYYLGRSLRRTPPF